MNVLHLEIDAVPDTIYV